MTDSERELYLEKAQGKIDQWNAEIDKMKAKVEQADADARIGYQRSLEEMRARRDEAEVQLRALQESSDEAWFDMKAGFDNAWSELSEAFKKALSRFK
ncbi:MAG: hypothetical protein HUJ27_00400 [Rhodobacteraceae bacterium]|nr:hypothetical protein [Paracoccaceae bacterium]